MPPPEFRVPHRFKIVFVWASVAVTLALVVYLYNKRVNYWERHVENTMQPIVISPVPVLSTELDSIFEANRLANKTPFTLYHFWATWCAPCRAEIPTLNALQKKFGDKLTIITISVDETKEDVQKFFANRAPQFQVLWDKSQKVAGQWGVQKYPESFLVSSDYKNAVRFSGARDWSSPEVADFFSKLIS